MEIFFLRHGEAEGLLYNTPEADFERELTDRGRRILTDEAVGLRHFVSGFDYILTSPLTRARQTAEIFASAYQCGERIRITSAVNPPCTPSDLLEEIALLGEPKRVLCVGHAPALGEMATYMLSGLDEENFFDIKKGGILGLQIDSVHPDAGARMLCFFPPEILQKMGSGSSAGSPPPLEAYKTPEPPAHRKPKEPASNRSIGFESKGTDEEPPLPEGWDSSLSDTPERRRNSDENQQYSGPLDRRGRQYPPPPEDEEDISAMLEEEVGSLQDALDSLMGGYSGKKEDKNARDALSSFLGGGSSKNRYEEPPAPLRGIDIQL